MPLCIIRVKISPWKSGGLGGNYLFKTIQGSSPSLMQSSLELALQGGGWVRVS